MKRLIRTILLAGVSWLALIAPASADPIIAPIAFALFAGPLGGVLTLDAIYTLTQIALAAAAIGVNYLALAPTRPNIKPQDAKNIFENEETSEINAIGLVKLGGLKAFGNSKGFNIDRVIWHCKGEMVSIVDYEVGGYSVVVDPDGRVSSPPWYRTAGSWLYIKSKAGTGDDTAHEDLIARYPDLLDENFRARGIFQSHVRYISPGVQDNNDKWTTLYGQGYPDVKVTARVRRIYDPRNPAHDIDDPATWTWTQNGPLCAAHIMSTMPDLTMDDFDWDDLALEADKADELVPTLTGTEKRSRCSGVWLSESARLDVMQQVLESIGAELFITANDKISIRLIDDDRAPEVSFTEKDLYNVTIKSGPEAVERVNLCRVTYLSTERDFELAEPQIHSFVDGVYTGPAWARITDEIARYGEKPFELELPFCPSSSQAQRIARRKFAMARADRGTIVTNMAGLAQWGANVISFPLPDCDDTVIAETEPQSYNDAEGEIEIPYVAIPASIRDVPWNPAVDEAPPPEVKPTIQLDSVLDTPIAPTRAIMVTYDGAPQVRLEFTGVSGASTAEATYRTYTDGLPDAYASMNEIDGPGSTWYATADADLDGRDVDFRVRFFNGEEESSQQSPVLEVRPLAYDNSAPSNPTIADGGAVNDPILGQVARRATISNFSFTAVSMTWTWSGNGFNGGGSFDIAPGGSIPVQSTNTGTAPVTFTARCFSSDGTASALVSATYG